MCMTVQDRIQQQLNTLALMTEDSPGITRLAFTDMAMKAYAYVQSLMEDIGMTVRYDAFGNMIGRLEGANENLAPIMIGSHLDSVPQGGNYDGVIGVLAGVEIAYRLHQSGQRQRALEVIVFQSEESSRFGTGTLGSQAYIGKLSNERLDVLKDKSGQTLRDILKEWGGRPEKIGAPLFSVPPKAFFEVHIEQGKVLEQAQIPIGIVTGIAAPTRYRVEIHGMADHSGATPMELRQDALCGAAEIVLAVEMLATQEVNPPAVGTVGVIDARPGAMNVIPGDVQLAIDLRSGNGVVKKHLSTGVVQKIKEICQRRGLEVEIKEVTDETPIALDENMINDLMIACSELQIPYKKMPSGAGHDAMFMAEKTPTGMLFIPCYKGISHNPAERAELEDIITAIDVLEVVVRKQVSS